IAKGMEKKKIESDYVFCCCNQRLCLPPLISRLPFSLTLPPPPPQYTLDLTCHTILKTRLVFVSDDDAESFILQEAGCHDGTCRAGMIQSENVVDCNANSPNVIDQNQHQ
ncbi:hypothetical protein J6590_099505, partial [Homalodisca vitripennis]